MPITDISSDWGVKPRIVRITTTDSLATITTAGYIASQYNYIVDIQHGSFEFIDGDLVAISYDVDQDFFTYDKATDTLIVDAVPGALSDVLNSGRIFVGNAGNIATGVAMTGDIGITNTGVSSIAAGVIVNADINAAAAIDYSKLAPLTSANILVGNAGNVATSVAMSGDIGITNAGVTAIAAGVIVNADISATAAIDYSKLAALTSAHILVGSAGNVATDVAMSGDVAISNVGATTIQNNAVTTLKIADANVTLGKLAAGITPSHVIKFGGQHTTTGGAPAETIAVAGAVAATDRAFVQLVSPGTNTVSVTYAVVTNDVLTVTFSADPGNDAIINYQIIRAAS